MNYKQDESPLSGRDGSRGPDAGPTADVENTDRRRLIKLIRAFSIAGALAMSLASVPFAIAPAGAEDAKDDQGTGGAAATLLAEQNYIVKDVIKPNLGVQGQNLGAGTPKVLPRNLPDNMANPKGIPDQGKICNPKGLPGDMGC